MLECVIFDLDGLMVDSEPLQFQAYREAFAYFGFELTIARWTQWHAVESSTRHFVESEELDLDAEAVRAKKKQIYDRMIADELRLKPGVSELVDALASGYRLCVASGSRRESIEGCLEKFSMLQHFEHLCSATEVKRSKPYPDVYLHALELMQVAPSSTLALEDSPTGLAAATAAGLTCVVCPDSFLAKPATAYTDATLRVESLTELNVDALEQLLIAA